MVEQQAPKNNPKQFNLRVNTYEFMEHFFESKLNMPKDFPKNPNLLDTPMPKIEFNGHDSAPCHQFSDDSYLLALGIQDYLTHCGYTSSIVTLIDKQQRPIAYLTKCKQNYFDVFGSFIRKKDIHSRPYGEKIADWIPLNEEEDRLQEQAKDQMIAKLDEFDDERWFEYGDNGDYKYIPTGEEMHYSEAFDQFLMRVGQHYFTQLQKI